MVSSSHDDRKTIETRLEAFLVLESTGLDNHYVKDNIKHYAEAYHELTGDWYRRSASLQKTIVGGEK